MNELKWKEKTTVYYHGVVPPCKYQEKSNLTNSMIQNGLKYSISCDDDPTEGKVMIDAKSQNPNNTTHLGKVPGIEFTYGLQNMYYS